MGCYDLFMGKFDCAQKQKVVLKWMKWGLVLFVIAVFAMYGYFDGYLSRRVVLSEPSLVTTETTAEVCYEKSMNIECLEGFGCTRVEAFCNCMGGSNELVEDYGACVKSWSRVGIGEFLITKSLVRPVIGFLKTMGLEVRVGSDQTRPKAPIIFLKPLRVLVTTMHSVNGRERVVVVDMECAPTIRKSIRM
ncbi:MAG: hypothetical protein UX11_C0006G0020 [Candidatus Collierbacteria bacterium GW2011_GWC2_45_40]|nr:MAG: hypothetical protein UX11_C0006G0020 [Candidatus Collierbacteria bacterium GW2011_GWC2_45_40]